MKKKGIIVVIALLLVAAVLAVVFVLLFKDKNTKSLATDLNTAVTTGYLSETSDEYTAIHGYLERYEGMSANNTEVTNYREILEAYTDVAVFFNNEAAFMQHSKVYSKNRKKIVSALKSAQSNATKLMNTIKEKQEITGGSERWEKVVWDNYKDYAQNMVMDTIKAFDLLSTVYSASVSSKLLNNDLTDILFMGLRHHADAFKEKPDGANLGLNLHRFTDAYFNPSIIEDAVLHYSYASKNVKNDVEDIKQNKEETLRWQQFLLGNITIR